VHLGLPYAGRIECFRGRMALHGTEAKTGAPRAVPISDIKQVEVTRRKPEPKPVESKSGLEPSRDARGETEKEQVVAVKPTEDRVLVKPIEAETKTASGIYLPETAKEKPVRGEVVATGPGKRLDNGKRAEMSVGVGDTVVYGKYAGTEVEIKGVKHLIIRESELLGVIEG
jgi:chaperonin GroES